MPLHLKLDDDTFANPQPPANYHPDQHNRQDSSGQPLTNADFRKLLMTPGPSTQRAESQIKTDINILKSKKSKADKSDKRKEKKLYYASLVKEAKEREVELSKKYRDRAKERRDHSNTNDQFVSTTANFRAVAPDATLEDNAERRKQIIEESKFLGGDLEHTHLVKGLDYALLQKVKAELETQAVDEDLDKIVQDDNDEDETAVVVDTKLKLAKQQQQQQQQQQLKAPLRPPTTTIIKDKIKEIDHEGYNNDNNDNDDDHDDTKFVFKSKLARNVYRAAFRPPLPKHNEQFLPRRMAYVIDLEDEETDIPITLLRSKAECPNKEGNTTVTTNDIVINKLTQILQYLRQGGKKDAKKLKKRGGKGEDEHVEQAQSIQSKYGKLPEADLGIYDDVDDYVPETTKRTEKSSKEELKKRNYFDNRNEIETKVKDEAPSKEAASRFIKSINEKYSNKTEAKKEEEKKMVVKFDADSYAECYPGTRAEEDVNVDSDDEPDFDKMDLGNKKGPVGRWDFDTNEEYSSYMSNKEALPKAAFQYGLKMAEGRKTRRVAFDPKLEKAKLDKEWGQISKIIEKRKQGDFGGADYKKPKY